MKTESFSLNNITFGGGKPLVLIAGPCIIESEEHSIFMAKEIKKIAEELGFKYVFKSSFDKANRTSIKSYRGKGFEEGLRILRKVKEQVGVPILTDVHEVNQLSKISEVADIIQIPAFLSRQTDLLVAAGETGKIINIKKGQFLAPWDIKNSVEKVYSTGNRKVLVTERGASFGYNNLVVDMRSIPIMRKQGFPVVYDATHSLQLPGGEGSFTGGMREHIPSLSRAAVSVGIDALFMEVHDNPNKALCDSTTQFPLRNLSELLITLKKIDTLVKTESID